MPYTAEISRSTPTAFLFLVDQSYSMSDTMPSGRSKAQFVADALNRTLANLIGRCSRAEGTRNFFDVGVLGYSDDIVRNGFAGSLSGTVLNPIAAVEAAPLRVETRTKRVDDGAGGLVDQTIRFPVWFEPVAIGNTPMCSAIKRAAEGLADWCDAHPTSYPPTVVHITDGESTDGDPESLAERLCQISTNDGSILLFNLHVSTSGADPVKFPDGSAALPDEFALQLFRMSSVFPPHLQQAAAEKGFRTSADSRGFMFNADAPEIVDFFDIGTRPSQLR